jgi:hypothetical protein
MPWRHTARTSINGREAGSTKRVIWLLGGEIIADLHENPRLRKRPMAEVVLAAVDDEGGPLIAQRSSEDQQRSLDATCRKLHRFLSEGACGG